MKVAAAFLSPIVIYKLLSSKAEMQLKDLVFKCTSSVHSLIIDALLLS